jgi:hypothetical protein
MLQFTTETLLEIYEILYPLYQQRLAGEILAFQVVNPDLQRGCFNGELVGYQGISYRYRSHKALMDFAELLHCRYLTPHELNRENSLFIEIRYELLPSQALQGSVEGDPEAYGKDSEFFRIQKLEEPYFLLPYQEALKAFDFAPHTRILNLGVHRGDEFKLFQKVYPPILFQSFSFIGIDHCPSAIEWATTHFPAQQFRFYLKEFQSWETWDFEPFDFLMSIGTLQSSSFEGKTIFSPILKRFLKKKACILLGFPQVRYFEGELIFGGKSKNYQKPEHSLVLADIAFYRKLLCRQGFQVKITGKYYLFLSAFRV